MTLREKVRAAMAAADMDFRKTGPESRADAVMEALAPMKATLKAALEACGPQYGPRDSDGEEVARCRSCGMGDWVPDRIDHAEGCAYLAIGDILDSFE